MRGFGYLGVFGEIACGAVVLMAVIAVGYAVWWVATGAGGRR